METYLSIKDCISNNIIKLGDRQIKRRIKNILDDLNDNRVMYEFRNGIKTIVLKLEYALTVSRNRKPKIAQTSINEIENIYNNNLIKTEITVHFNEEFDFGGIKCIVDYYESKYPVVYINEGKNKNKQHLHIAVGESIDDAKDLICKSLEINGINLKNTDIKISQIISASKIIHYLNKFSWYGTYLGFKNFNTYLLSNEYLNRCDAYIQANRIKKGIISPYGKKTFTNKVFKHKAK